MKRILYRLLFAAVLAACIPAVSSAAPGDGQAGSLDTLRREVKGIRKILAALPRLSGYGQVGYQYETNRGGVEGADASTFMVKRVRLIMTGDISKVFEYKMQLEGNSTSRGSDSKALISMQDWYFKAKICPALQIWAGQFPIPLTIENYDISPGTLETPDFSAAINKMVCRNAVSGILTYGRDIGLQATGGFLRREGYSILDYNLCVYNGAQMNSADDNQAKDIVARLTVRPIRDLRISGSVNWGEYPNAKYGKYIPMTRYAVGAWYDSAGLMVRGEYAHAGADTGFGEKGTARVDEHMYYVIAGYKIRGKYMPLLRYDVFDCKRNTCLGGAGKQQDFLVGFLWTPLSRLKVQADYTLSTYDANRYSAADFGTRSGSKLQLMVIGYF